MTFFTPNALNPATTVVSVSLNGQDFTEQPAVHSPAKSVTYDYYREPYASVHFPVRGPTNGGTLIKAQGYGFALHRSHVQDKLWARFMDADTQQKELAPPTEVKRLTLDTFEWLTPPVPGPQEALL